MEKMGKVVELRCIPSQGLVRGVGREAGQPERGRTGDTLAQCRVPANRGRPRALGEWATASPEKIFL